jgi:hypothetical protein
VSVLTRE